MRTRLAGIRVEPWAAAVLFALGAFARTRNFLGGRLWAEEATVFFEQLSQRSWLSAFTFLFYGHVELSTSVLVFVSTRVPIGFAAALTTWISVAIAALFPLTLWRCRTELRLNDFGWLVVVSAWLALPQSEEVWGTTIGLQWQWTLTAAVLASVPATGTPLRMMAFAVAGLSGIPATFLVPTLALRALQSRSRAALYEFSALTAPALLQLGLLTIHGFGGRTIAGEPGTKLLGVLAQQVYSTALGAHSDAAIRLLANNPPSLGSWTLRFVALAVMLTILYMSLRSSVVAVRLLALSGLAVQIMTVVGAGEDPAIMVSRLGSGRYTYVPSVLMVLSAWLVFTTEIQFRKLAVAAGAFATLGASQILISGIRNEFSGPVWRDALEAAQVSKVVEVWPAGWSMPLPKQEKAQ